MAAEGEIVRFLSFVFNDVVIPLTTALVTGTGALLLSATTEVQLRARALPPELRQSFTRWEHIPHAMLGHLATILLIGVSLAAVFHASPLFAALGTAVRLVPGASFVAAWLGQHPLVANLISLVLDLAKDIAVPDSTTKALRALVTFFVSTGFYTVVKENLCPTEGTWWAWPCHFFWGQMIAVNMLLTQITQTVVSFFGRGILTSAWNATSRLALSVSVSSSLSLAAILACLANRSGSLSMYLSVMNPRASVATSTRPSRAR